MLKGARNLSPVTLALAFVLGSVGLCGGGPQAPFALGDVAIVDGDTRRAFLMAGAGGIEAIATESGRALWSTKAAERPLLLAGSQLLAQAADRGDRLRLVLLDAGSGRALSDQSIPLPPGVKAALDDDPWTSFRISAWPEASGAVIAWRQTRRQIGPTGATGSSMEIQGALRFDFESHKTEALAGEPPRPPEEPLPAPLEAALRERSMPERPIRAGPWFALAVREPAGGEERLVLRRWTAASGEPLETIVLAQGSLAVPYVSSDRRHLIVSRREQDGRNRWSVRRLDTGEAVAELAAQTVAPGAFCILPSAVLHVVQPRGWRSERGWVEEPLSLRAVYVRSEREAWRRALRDTAYRGPLPSRSDSAPQRSRRPDGR